MPHSPAIRLVRTLVLMFAVAEWCWSMLGVTRIDAVLLITFAWASTILRRMMTEAPVAAEVSRWTSEVTAAVAGGQLLWVLLPWLRAAQPHGWFWLPVAVPTPLFVVGAAVAACWPLHPFVLRFCRRQRPWGSAAANFREWEVAALSGSFFLVSGSLVFAVVAVASLGGMTIAGAVGARAAEVGSEYLPVSSAA